MLRAFVDWVKPPPVRNAAGLEELVERQTARLTMQSTVNFCRIKASANAKKLFEEDVFRVGLHICRWEAYAAILADAIRVTEAYLRPAAGEHAATVAERLVAFHARCLAVEARPNGGDWGEAVEELRHDLALAQMAQPRMAHDIGSTSGNIVFDLLPIHKSLRREDREVVVNQIRFGLASLRQEIERRGDPAALVADYLRAGADGG